MSTIESSPKYDSDISPESPWLGLMSYMENYSDYFYGRDRETIEIFRLVKREVLTVIFGQSGLGKTSLIHAGLFPRLREDDFVPVYIRLDFSENSPNFTSQIRAAITFTLKEQHIDAQFPNDSESLWEYFHHVDTDFWSTRNRLLTLVLVFDQFEEIFTFGRSNEHTMKKVGEFLTEISNLVENRPPDSLNTRIESDPELGDSFNYHKQNCKVIFSLREDFLPDLEDVKNQIRSIGYNRFRLTRMNGLQALDVVLKPGKALIDENVAVRLVQFVAGAGEIAVEEGYFMEELGKLEIEPALLSVVCRELNIKRLQQFQPKITSDLFIGSKSDILMNFYTRSISDLPISVQTFIEDRLITRSGYRNSIALEEVLDVEGISGEVVETLINRRLLRLDELYGVQRVELTHDVLTEVVQASRDRRHEEERIAQEKQRSEKLRKKLLKTRVAEVVALFLIVVSGILLAAYIHSGMSPLMYASRYGSTTIARFLINHGSDVEEKHKSGMTPLLYACYYGHPDIARLLLDKNVNLDAKDRKGMTSLMYASKSGNTEIARLLLPLKAVPKDEDSDKWASLMLSLDSGGKASPAPAPDKNSKSGQAADTDAKDDAGRTAIMFASENSNTEIVRLLLDSGADIEARDSHGSTPLYYTRQSGNIEIAGVLLDHGADLEAKDNDGLTLLSCAASTNQPELVTFLLDRGADRETRSKAGETPLMLASQKGTVEIAKLLLDHGAGIETRDNSGMTPLMHAARKGNVKVTELLLERGADITAKDYYGRTPLTTAAFYDHTGIAGLLLDHGANIEVKDRFEWTPLMWASYEGHQKMAAFLIERGADSKARGDFGWTPLFAAVIQNKIDLVSFLLDHGAGIEAKDTFGWTPLMRAAYYGRRDIVTLLLEKGANAGIESILGETPAIAACQGGHREIYTLLTGGKLPDIDELKRPAQGDSAKVTEEFFRSLICCGDICIQESELEKAKEIYSEALDYAKDGTKEMALACDRMAMIKNEFRNYSEAAKYMKKKIAVLKKMGGSSAQSYPLFTDYYMLAWYDILSRTYKEAIGAASEGLRLKPDDDWLMMVLAHGYLLDNQYNKAIRIHQSQRHVMFRSGQSWPEMASNDFKALRYAGIHHPGMDKTEEILRSGEIKQ